MMGVIDAIKLCTGNDMRIIKINFDQADIFTGVSRSGKTPASLYLAMQYGIKRQTTRLPKDDFSSPPGCLKSVKDQQEKLFGLTKKPQRFA